MIWLCLKVLKPRLNMTEKTYFLSFHIKCFELQKKEKENVSKVFPACEFNFKQNFKLAEFVGPDPQLEIVAS